MAGVDPMAELEAEMKKQKEARAAQNRLKAQQEALFDLTAAGNNAVEEPPKQKERDPAKQDPPKQSSNAAASSSSSAPRAPASGSAANAVFIPKSWATAGQEPDLLEARDQDRDVAASSSGQVVIENESISLAMCGCGGPGGGAGTQFFAMAGLHPPSDASFEAFFRDWFDREYFPPMNSDLKRELVHRAKSKGFFSGLSSQVKKWAMANTDARLQSDVWCSYFLSNAPPRFKVVGPMKVASINLGSQVSPCWIPFWGLPLSEEQRLSGGGTGQEGAKWILPPFCSSSPDVEALLDELDGRGGMAALMSSAAGA